MKDHPDRLQDIIDLDHVLDNSFKNFHVKGFDYLCVRRSARITDKLYFFDGDISKLPEVVNPHDHRYAFNTKVLAGRSKNTVYQPSLTGQVYNRFDYLTPLNGGDGFHWSGYEHLDVASDHAYAKGEGYSSGPNDIHTISILEDRTILWLRQFEDVVPLGKPTSTYSVSDKAPALDGLYARMTPHDVIAKMRILSDIGYPLKLIV